MLFFRCLPRQTQLVGKILLMRICAWHVCYLQFLRIQHVGRGARGYCAARRTLFMVGDEQATTGAENKKSLMRLLLVPSPGLTLTLKIGSTSRFRRTTRQVLNYEEFASKNSKPAGNCRVDLPGTCCRWVDCHALCRCAR